MAARWIKWAIGVLLIPWAWGATYALIRRLGALGDLPQGVLPLAMGFFAGLVVFGVIARGRRLYVLAHELTHVVWGWFFGAKVRRMRVGKDGGFVELTRDNFLISLAPYFFPFYALLWLAGAGVWAAYQRQTHLGPPARLVLGVAYAFHVVWTARALRRTQDDLRRHGVFFSLIVLWLGNAMVLLMGLVLLTPGSNYAETGSWIWEGAGRLLQKCFGWIPGFPSTI